MLVPKDSGSRRLAEGVSYGDAKRQKLDIYAPKDLAEQRVPVIMFFYGGSWGSGTRKGYEFVGRALAARGYLTILPDYRLVPHVTYPGFVEDGAAAIRWAIAHVADYGGDAANIVLMGHSAGAYIASMVAYDERWLEADREAVTAFVGLAGPYDFAPFRVEATKSAFGDWSAPAETQPVNWVDAGDPPALLLVGRDDETVLPRNSESLAGALRQAGVPVELKWLERTGHIGIVAAIAKPFRGNAPVLEEAIAYIDRMTGSKVR